MNKLKQKQEFTAIITKEVEGYTVLNPEFDVASQGSTIEEARSNLIEALELFLETASQHEIKERFNEIALITRVQVSV